MNRDDLARALYECEYSADDYPWDKQSDDEKRMYYRYADAALKQCARCSKGTEGAEPVAWQYRLKGNSAWSLCVGVPGWVVKSDKHEYRPLFSHPPVSAEREALEKALSYYDKLDREHAPGEAALLDEMAAALSSTDGRSSAGRSDNKLKAFADDCRGAAREYDDMAGKGRRISAETVAAAYRRIARELDALHIPVVSDKASLERVFDRLGTRLNNVLCEMKPDHDDSIVGFNEAWDVMRAIFKEELERQ